MISYWIKWDNQPPELWKAKSMEELWHRIWDQLVKVRKLEWMVEYE